MFPYDLFIRQFVSLLLTNFLHDLFLFTGTNIIEVTYWSRARTIEAGMLDSNATQVIPKTSETVLAACHSSCSAFMGGCKERFKQGAAIALPAVQH